MRTCTCSLFIEPRWTVRCSWTPKRARNLGLVVNHPAPRVQVAELPRRCASFTHVEEWDELTLALVDISGNTVGEVCLRGTHAAHARVAAATPLSGGGLVPHDLGVDRFAV